MKADIKQMFVTALRSGDYRQGLGRLRPTDDTYCATGVLCDMHRQAIGGQWSYCPYDVGTPGNKGFWMYGGRDGNFLALPPSVDAWAGIEWPDIDQIVRMNDSGKSFTEIADWIEANL